MAKKTKLPSYSSDEIISIEKKEIPKNRNIEKIPKKVDTIPVKQPESKSQKEVNFVKSSVRIEENKHMKFKSYCALNKIKMQTVIDEAVEEKLIKLGIS